MDAIPVNKIKKQGAINVKPPVVDDIPKELKNIPQWVAWKAVPGKNGKTDKIPYSPVTHRKAKANDPLTWGTYDNALKYFQNNQDKLNGIGFELSADNSICGIDLDDCVNSSGIENWAWDVIQKINSYTEYSPSGKGIRIFCKGNLPASGRKKGKFECYESGRFLTCTGNHIPWTPVTVEYREQEIKQVHEEIFPTRGAQKTEARCDAGSGVGLADRELLNKAKNSKNGSTFAQLWGGNWGEYSSQSEGDQAFCNYLAFWTGRDAGRMDRLFRQSGLYREKWEEKHYADGRTYGQGTIEKAIASTDEAYRPSKKEKSEPKEKFTQEGSKVVFNLTDLGNAERFADQNKNEVRYLIEAQKWLLFDGTRWVIDTCGEIYQKAKGTIRSIYKEAASAQDDDQRKALAKHAMRCEAATKIRYMLELASKERGVPVSITDLDTVPFLLNCLNGTIDLRTGEVREHRKEDLITKLAPVKYDPSADSELFENFLERVLPGGELRKFVQKAFGYSATGDVGEEKLFFPFGPPATGKSTLLSAVEAALGDYAAMADFETFLQKDRGSEGPRNDIARLAGKRLVLSLEVQEGKKLAESLINQITGGDTVAARYLYKESFEFVPSFKLWLAANNRPKITGSDGAIWRRILQIPFDQVIPEQERDPSVKTKLRDVEVCGPAVLAWVIKGCLLWQKERLDPPAAVRELTDEYRKDQDPLKDFLEDCCVIQGNAQAKNKQLWESYTIWCRENGEKYPIGRKKFTQLLFSKGMDQFHDGRHRMWIGLCLKDSIHF